MEEEIEPEGPEVPKVRGRYIKKRALKNKAVSVSFDEKDLKDYVTGFHKRKKKRRKEAERKQEEAKRLKRLEERKKRRLEKEFALYGGNPPATDSVPDETEEYLEEDGEAQPMAPITGTTLYDNGNMKVTVITSEIAGEEENIPSGNTPATVLSSIGVNKKHNIPVHKSKSFKKVARHKSQSKPQNKRNKKKGKRKNQNQKRR
ncbi:ribosomal RNA-processing protein 17 [Mangifera indica]|uniref:ribosomal RNA-processing protein 17 n=1 Tax=Mangifera indica TaxID=29780 RepID=UPI001CFAB654|nr:ribosomal RNA-processing protein 17 [Mangifera indica]